MDNRIKKLFELYESGQANDEERKIVEDWFASFDNLHENKLTEEEKNSLFKPVDKEIQHILQKSSDQHRFNNNWLMIAAGLLLAFGVTIIYFKFHTRAAYNPVSYSYISTKRGVKKEFSLPDGSIVYLNSGSIIRIPSNFNEKTRELTLSGEAYFQISHNVAKPFTIRSGKLLITDLGTSFNVKAYPEETQIRVSVESGKVKVEKNTASGNPELFAASITQNQQLTYDEKTNSHFLSNTQTQNVIAWHKNELFFVNASFEEIAATLQRWYNVTIKLDNSSGQSHRYTVSFNHDEPIGKVLNVFEKLSGVTYKIKDSTIFINLKKEKNNMK